MNSWPETQLAPRSWRWLLKAGKFIFQDRDALGKTQPLMDSGGFGSRSRSGINNSAGQNLSSGSSKLDRSDAARL